MNVSSIDSAYRNHVNASFLRDDSETKTSAESFRKAGHDNPDGKPSDISFKGAASDGFWRTFKKLSNYMKESDEMVSNIIQFFGTAAIAPFAIMVSPSKGAVAKLPKEEQREKKKFQALRQPVSALLAFGFQAPTTLGIKKLLNKWAFEDHKAMFDDKTEGGIGKLIPPKDYLKKKVKKVLNKEMTDTTVPKIEGFNGTIDLKAAREEIKEKIRAEYKESGIDIAEEKLEKMVTKKKLVDHVADKIAAEQHSALLDKKVQEFAGKNLVINDIDLVTQKYQDLMKNDFKAEFEALKNEHKIGFFDGFLEAIGLPSKRMQAYRAAESKLAKEKGLAYLKEKQPELFTNSRAKLKNYLENKNQKAQSVFKRKVDLTSMFVNIGVFAISCLALNWLHPKFVRFLENHSKKNKENRQNEMKKVEVAA